MIFSQDRNELRQMYRDAWRKQQNGEVLSPLDAQIAAVVDDHPEYHEFVQKGDQDEDFTGDGGVTNPYLHMGMHLALREQVSVDRPAGVRQVFERLAARRGDSLAAEHEMMEVLAVMLWETQSAGQTFDERDYVERLKRLTRP